MSSNLTTIRFHFFSLYFEPVKDLAESKNSNTILRDVITFVSQERKEGRGYLIDKNQNRKNEDSRELFMTSAVIMHKERRVRCSIALLRSGRIPKLKPIDKFKLIPLQEMGEIAEETHFYIDYSRNQAVVCVEYNYYGPRMSDIEYYLRNIANSQLKLSRKTEVLAYMGTSIEKTLKSLKNVLNLDIKLQPKKISQMDTELVGKYFTGLNSIGNYLKPNFLKLEAMFQTPGNNVHSNELNKEANNMVVDLLNKFKTRPFNIDAFDNFVVKYEDKDGMEEVFNLLKEKKEVSKEIDLTKIKKKRHLYELIELDFDNFMQDLTS